MLGSTSSFAAWALLAFLIACVLVGLHLEKTRIQRKRARFSGREPLTPEQIFSRYYSTSELSITSVSKTWNDIARLLKIDPQLLRPEDRLDIQLTPEKGFPMEDELADLNEYIQTATANTSATTDRRALVTVNDIIHLVAAAKSSRAEAQRIVPRDAAG